MSPLSWECFGNTSLISVYSLLRNIDKFVNTAIVTSADDIDSIILICIKIRGNFTQFSEYCPRVLVNNILGRQGSLCLGGECSGGKTNYDRTSMCKGMCCSIELVLIIL